MGFDAVDRAYNPASRKVKLECVGCGSTDGVTMMMPISLHQERPHEPLALCTACAWLAVPALFE